MALNGQQWYGPPETVSYIRELERVVSQMQRDIETLKSQVSANSRK